MGFARSLARASLGGTSSLSTPEKWVEDWFTGGGSTTAGVHVDQGTALHYGPFFAGVRVISEDLASLPLPLYERLQPRGKSRATSHPLYGLLHDAPNDLMGSMQLRETVQAHALTWGNGLAYIVRNGAGQATELWPLRPDRTTPELRRTNAGAFKLTYAYADEVNGIYARLLPDEVLHIAGPGFDGVRGYSMVWMARNAIGLGLATETYGSSFFGNGSRPGGVLQHPGSLSPEARKRMATDWENLHRGLDRAQRVAILEEGVTWQQTGIPPEDAQFLETRKMQVTEMARWLRVPPHKIADLERATFSNIESQQIDYVASALRSWLVRWEQAILVRLLQPSERGRYFAEHLVDGLLRGDTSTRYAAYAIGRQWGWLSADDVREKENANPLPDGRGETYLVPLNMVPATAPGETPPQPAADPPTAEEDEGQGEEDEEERARAVRLARVLYGRGAQGRRRIQDSYAEKIEDADREVARLERKQVTALVGEHLAARSARSTSAFLAALEDLFSGTVLETMRELWLPIFTAFAADIATDAAADVEHEEAIDLTAWVQAYVAAHTAYQTGSARGQLRALVDEADNAENAAASVLERLDKWVAKRPERTAKWESNQMANAAAREAWRESGVERLKWVTSGGNCPYCQKLEGTTVAIADPFVPAGGSVTGLETTLQVDRDTHHPPIHPGCDCQVVPA